MLSQVLLALLAAAGAHAIQEPLVNCSIITTAFQATDQRECC